MELPLRAPGDMLLPPGEMLDIRRRLRSLAPRHDLATVIACAFDHRTRILPFVFADLRMAPAGVRALGSALVDSGFEKTRIVLQQWNRNFQPAHMRLDGRVPDLFLVSSMHLHSVECDRLIAEANQIDPAHRPLIVVGGPRIIYEPWLAWPVGQRGGPDVAVTGEEYVLLRLLEVVLSQRTPGQSLREAFYQARDAGALDEVPGLVYGQGATPESRVEELVDTGVQRLLGDLDELPLPNLGFRILETPSRGAALAAQPLAANRVRRHSLISSLVMTFGCKFRCAYCPIPAYNQRQHRVKSGRRLADEIELLHREFGLVNFFGTDDNFLNETRRTLEIAEEFARRGDRGQKPFGRIRWGTEGTVHDTIRMQEHLPLLRRAGLFGLWMGVEDLTGTLVKKGQSEAKTLEAFRLLRQAGIYPIPMMMHHDSQPLVTRHNNYGLLNQLRVLRKAGALYTQVLMLTPASGSKWYEGTFESQQVFSTVGGEPVSPHRFDGNYVIASKSRRPWLKQFNLLAGYFYFFNPVRMAWALVASKSNVPGASDETRSAEHVRRYSTFKRLRRRVYLAARGHLIDAGVQALGMAGLFHTVSRTIPWAWKLFRHPVEVFQAAPISRLPMRSPAGQAAAHALPGTPQTAEALPLLPVMPSAEQHGCGRAA